jgi:hypothetical protein
LAHQFNLPHSWQRRHTSRTLRQDSLTIHISQQTWQTQILVANIFNCIAVACCGREELGFHETTHRLIVSSSEIRPYQFAPAQRLYGYQFDARPIHQTCTPRVVCLRLVGSCRNRSRRKALERKRWLGHRLPAYHSGTKRIDFGCGGYA